jgi:hypothetical protein
MIDKESYLCKMPFFVLTFDEVIFGKKVKLVKKRRAEKLLNLFLQLVKDIWQVIQKCRTGSICI